MTSIDPNLIDLSQAADTQQAKQVIVQGAAVGTLVCVQEALEKLGVESTIEEFRVRYLISDMEVGDGDKKLHFARLRVGNNIWDGKLRTARGWQEAFVDDFPQEDVRNWTLESISVPQMGLYQSGMRTKISNEAAQAFSKGLERELCRLKAEQEGELIDSLTPTSTSGHSSHRL